MKATEFSILSRRKYFTPFLFIFVNWTKSIMEECFAQ